MRKVAVRCLIAVALACALSACGCAQTDGSGGGGRPQQAAAAFDYSAGISEETGWWEGVDALGCVTLADYEPIVLDGGDVLPSLEEVEAVSGSFLQGNARRLERYEGVAEIGDTVNVDFVGRVDGEPIDGGSTAEGAGGVDIELGAGACVDGFEEQVAGHSPGDTFEVRVAPAQLGGTEAVFEVTLHYIVDQELPELTDDWVRGALGEQWGWSTVEDMYGSIYRDLLGSSLGACTQDYVMMHSEVREIPDQLMAYQRDSLASQYRACASSLGMDLEDALLLLEGVPTLEEALAAHEQAMAENAKSYLLAQAIAQKEGVRAGEGEVEGYFEKYLPDEDRSEFEMFYGKGYTHLVVMAQMVSTLLVDNTLVRLGDGTLVPARDLLDGTAPQAFSEG